MAAILGQKPTFDTKIPIVRPTLPQLTDVQPAIEQIFATRMVTKGPFLAEFERTIADYLGVRHAIAVSNCTTGLMLGYKCLGIEGEVIAPSFTFMATISALVWAGLTPVFVDVDAGTTNLDPAAAERAITPRTSAIVATHNFGNPADVEALEALAKKRGLKLIFDAAHGFGTLYRGGPVGGQGDIQAFSLTPTKLLIAGEGGVVTTNSDELAERVRMGREYGSDGKYGSALAGLNGRLGEFNAMLALHGLADLDSAARRRNEYAARYTERLRKLPGIGFQQIDARDRCSFKDFSIVIDGDKLGLTRDELAAALAADNIDTRKYYYPAVHRHVAYAQYAPAADLPATTLLENGSLSLPMWSDMPDAVIEGVCSSIERIAERAAQVRLALTT